MPNKAVTYNAGPKLWDLSHAGLAHAYKHFLFLSSCGYDDHLDTESARRLMQTTSEEDMENDERETSRKEMLYRLSSVDERAQKGRNRGSGKGGRGNKQCEEEGKSGTPKKQQSKCEVDRPIIGPAAFRMPWLIWHVINALMANNGGESSFAALLYAKLLALLLHHLCFLLLLIY